MNLPVQLHAAYPNLHQITIAGPAVHLYLQRSHHYTCKLEVEGCIHFSPILNVLNGKQGKPLKWRRRGDAYIMKFRPRVGGDPYYFVGRPRGFDSRQTKVEQLKLQVLLVAQKNIGTSSSISTLSVYQLSKYSPR